MKTQLGVQTMAYYGWRFGGDEQDGDKKTGTFALHTLKDNETIARLATGLKRFEVPDEFNWIKIYERVAGRARTIVGRNRPSAISARNTRIAASIRAPPSSGNAPSRNTAPAMTDWRQKRLDQIVGNWGRFENVQMQPAGKESIVDFRFRNGNKVTFEAHAVNVAKLLDDVKAYLEANPGNKLDWNNVNLQNIGYRLVEQQAEAVPRRQGRRLERRSQAAPQPRR